MAKSPKPPEAPVDPMESAFYREIDEDLRRERMIAFWKRYGGLIAGVALLLALIAVGYQGWRYWQGKEATEAAELYGQAIAQLEAGDTAAANTVFGTIAGEYKNAFGTLALLQQAAVAASEGRREDAARAYQQVAMDNGAEATYRDLARILGASNGIGILGDNEIDQLLNPLRSSVGWRYAAEELAAYQAINRGDKAMATTLLSGLAENPQVSMVTRQRVGEMMKAFQLTAGTPETATSGTPATSTPAPSVAAPANEGSSAVTPDAQPSPDVSPEGTADE